MNNISKNMIKCVAVLVVIAAVSGLLLGFFNEITYVSDDEMMARDLNKIYTADSFEKILQTDDAVLFEAKEGSETFFVATASGKGYAGYVPIYVKIVNGEIVSVKEGTNQETISTPFGEDYISQFLGYEIETAKDFSLTDESKNLIDGVSRATKTSNAIVDGVNKCMQIYREYEVAS